MSTRSSALFALGALLAGAATANAAEAHYTIDPTHTRRDAAGVAHDQFIRV